MRILVTGGAGFVGSHLCERLLGEEDPHGAVGDDAFRDEMLEFTRLALTAELEVAIL